jgi:NADH:ubiquinone oxidoreductase subunit 2 (chain N)
MLYLAVYSFMTLGAFAVVAMVRKEGVDGDEIEDFAGLSTRHPVAALLMLVFMVSLAGIPPTAGFIGKFYLFMAAIKAGADLACHHRGRTDGHLGLLLSSSRHGHVHA